MKGCDWDKKKFQVGGYNPIYSKGWSNIFSSKIKLKRFVNKVLEFDYYTLFKYLLLTSLLIYLIVIKTC